VIFGTVGTHTAPFDRLVRALDELAGATAERVVIQMGPSDHRLRAATGFAVVASQEFTRYMEEARVIVTHCGDTVLEAVALGVPVVVVPRRHAYGEAIDDHQVELAQALAARGLVTWAEPEGLAAAVDRAVPATERPDASRLVENLRAALHAP
jgi:UDP-N-acetylglucosamine transferase subunit ALG13